MATALTTEIYDCLKDHVILTCGDRMEENVYDCWAPVEMVSILEDAHVSKSVYVHPIDNNDPTCADMWCSVTWDSAGHMETIGFNYMSEKRMDDFTKFNEWGKAQARAVYYA